MEDTVLLESGERVRIPAVHGDPCVFDKSRLEFASPGWVDNSCYLSGHLSCRDGWGFCCKTQLVRLENIFAVEVYTVMSKENYLSLFFNIPA